jgi:hypothetical protein
MAWLRRGARHVDKGHCVSLYLQSKLRGVCMCGRPTRGSCRSRSINMMLLDWTGRELRADKRGAIPEHLAPIVERLGLNQSNWVETVRGFGRLFKQAAGRSSLLVDAVARCSRRWFQEKEAARMAFL